MSLRSTIGDVLNDRANFDFLGRRRIFFVLSALALIAGFAALGIKGLNLGIDFEGGTAWQVTAEGRDPRAGQVRDALRPLGEGNAKVTVLGESDVRVQSITTEADEVAEVTEALAEYANVEPGAVSIQTVGPTFGEEITEKAVRALVVFLIAVTLYLAFRFEFKMAVGAMAALAHDIGLTVGVYALSGFEVSPATVIAILTILGYSLYDTVVVFDKIKENTDRLGTSGNRTYGDTVNASLNQVLMRSLNTTVTTLIPVASLLVVGGSVFGAITIRDFSLALLVGLMAGAYSSIFIAAPVLTFLKEREPRYRALRRRVEARQAGGDGADDVDERDREERGDEPVLAGARRSAGDPVIRPRPRRQRRRKRRR